MSSHHTLMIVAKFNHLKQMSETAPLSAIRRRNIRKALEVPQREPEYYYNLKAYLKTNGFDDSEIKEIEAFGCLASDMSAANARAVQFIPKEWGGQEEWRDEVPELGTRT